MHEYQFHGKRSILRFHLCHRGCGISGNPDAIKLSINASTERNTAIYLPLYNAREVQQSDFITFIQENDQVEELPAMERSWADWKWNLNVEVTEEAVVQMIFDPKVGDIIETSGRGNLRMMLDQNQGFRMFGDVELLKGDYLFTLQNVINKRFEIEPGEESLSADRPPMPPSTWLPFTGPGRPPTTFTPAILPIPKPKN